MVSPPIKFTKPHKKPRPICVTGRSGNLRLELYIDEPQEPGDLRRVRKALEDMTETAIRWGSDRMAVKRSKPCRPE